MKYKALLLFILIGMVAAEDSCTRPYNRIGNLCCPDYDNDLVCDLHPTSTTVPTTVILNSTHLYDTNTNITFKLDEEKIKKLINISQIDNAPPIFVKPPRVKTTTTSTTTSTISIKTSSKPTTTTIKQYTTTTTIKEYQSSNRVTPMPKEESIVEKYKYHIGGSVVTILILFILFLYFIGNEDED